MSDSFSVLRYHDFRCYLASRFFSNVAIQMQVLVISWYVWRITHDPLALGLIGLAEFVPFALLALWGGHVADRHEKKRLIIMGEVLHLGSTLMLLWLVHTGTTKVVSIYVVICLTGVIRSFLWSATQAYVQQAVPQEVFGKAAAWNSSAWEISAIGGPALGGVIYAWAGPTTALGVVALSMAVATLAAWNMGPRHPTPRHEAEPLGQSLVAGLRFVFSNQVLLGALALDMFAVLFGGATALMPIFADRMGVGPEGLGWLRAAPAIGAILMALYQTSRPPYQQAGKTLLGAVTVFGICMVAFAFSSNFWLSMAFLMLSGMADNISVVIRLSIVQAFTPDHMRGRVSAVNGIFIGSSNELGAFESGLAARLMGTIPSVVFGGCMTLLTVALIFWRVPRLRTLTTIRSK